MSFKGILSDLTTDSESGSGSDSDSDSDPRKGGILDVLDVLDDGEELFNSDDDDNDDDDDDDDDEEDDESVEFFDEDEDEYEDISSNRRVIPIPPAIVKTVKTVSYEDILSSIVPPQPLLNIPIINPQGVGSLPIINPQGVESLPTPQPLLNIPIINPQGVGSLPIVAPQPLLNIPIINPQGVGSLPIINPQGVGSLPIINPQGVGSLVVQQKDRELTKWESSGNVYINRWGKTLIQPHLGAGEVKNMFGEITPSVVPYTGSGSKYDIVDIETKTTQLTFDIDTINEEVLSYSSSFQVSKGIVNDEIFTKIKNVVVQKTTDEGFVMNDKCYTMITHMIINKAKEGVTYSPQLEAVIDHIGSIISGHVQ
jgi:hypothetical protein